MRLSFKLKVNATDKDIWKYYKNIKKWKFWNDDLTHIELEPRFEVGAKGILLLKEEPPIPFTIIAIDSNVSFCSRHEIEGIGSVDFHHHILYEDASFFVEHSIELANTPVSFSHLSMLQQLFEDVPKSVFALKEVVEKHTKLNK